MLFGDKAYKRSDEYKVELEQELKVLTPIKKQRGQYYLSAEDQKYSNAVSRIRQPIEALFAWLNKVTGIEDHQTSVHQKGYLPIFMGESCSDDASELSCTWLLIRVYGDRDKELLKNIPMLVDPSRRNQVHAPISFL